MPISARMQGIEDSYEQAAMDLYATRRQAFTKILLPLMMPGIISGFLLAFIISLDDFIITNFVKGAGVETPADGDLRCGQAGDQTQYHGNLDHASCGVGRHGHDLIFHQQIGQCQITKTRR